MSYPLRIGAPLTGPLERPEIAAPQPSSGASFGDMFKKAINDTSGMQDNAQDLIASYLRGEPVELHQVMAASEEASISLELLVELRNKLTDAYKTVMNIQ